MLLNSFCVKTRIDDDEYEMEHLNEVQKWNVLLLMHILPINEFVYVVSKVK